ncbi:MAG: IPT/TIG domain-containing protein [Patescibacteria group bacterium]
MRQKISFLIGFFAVAIAIMIVSPVSAATIWSDDMESGEGSWSKTGFWHLQENPQNYNVIADLYDNVVQLPDSGYLPTAKSGNSVWWYGETTTGTFIGYPYADQSAWSGGTSTSSNTGNLVTTQIDLTGVNTAALSFWAWWEIEGVDSDRYDMMHVDVSTDGTTYTNIGNINPQEDVDAPSYRAYSSGGVGAPGVWVNPKFDLTDYVGHNVYVRFRFETVDSLYNAFRGWLIDDVAVTDELLEVSFANAKATATQSCSGFSGGAQTSPATFSLNTAQTVSVSYSQSYSITPYGSYSWVCSNKNKCYLPAGTYTLWSNLNKPYCPSNSGSSATVTYKKGAPWPSANHAGGLTTIFGSGFYNGMNVNFTGGSAVGSLAAASTEATSVSVINSHEAIVETPSTLTDGTYGINIENATGTVSKNMKKAFTVTSETAPSISSVSPTSVNNDVVNEITVTGYGFKKKSKVTVGGVPLKKIQYDATASTLTGNLPKGDNPGYANVEVLNPDGQLDTEVGTINIVSVKKKLYTGKEGANKSKPGQVKKLKIANLNDGGTNVKVTWKKISRANRYVIQLKQGKTLVKKWAKRKKANLSIDETYLQAGNTYKIKVRAKNGYGAGKFSKFKSWTTQ